MSNLGFFWSDSYFSRIKGLALKGMPCINVSYHLFTPDELRSFRSVEIVMMPSGDNEIKLAKTLLDECNKYGVVAIIKKEAL